LGQARGFAVKPITLLHMDSPNRAMLLVGGWCVNPASGEISRHGETVRIDVRTMRLLVCLAEHAGEIVSIDELLTRVWPDVVVSPDSVYQAVATLRRVLGDDPKQPAYIATVPRLGYRMLASVGPWTPQSTVPDGAAASAEALASETTASAPAIARVSAPRVWAVGGLCLVLVAAVVFFTTGSHTNRQPLDGRSMFQKSVAVLPFLDLTEKMSQEEFADGLTEEVIDRLGKIPGLHVPPPTSSFYFKNKRRSVAEIAKALNVTYVLDGSTRKSGARLRVAARLIRADSGVVVWSDSYDRPWGDTLTIQDDIAGEVTKALRATIESAAS
jgi:TolB-like protein/DNA-binding winged helix-turn-helix (wHTH) protein